MDCLLDFCCVPSLLDFSSSSVHLSIYVLVDDWGCCSGRLLVGSSFISLLFYMTLGSFLSFFVRFLGLSH